MNNLRQLFRSLLHALVKQKFLGVLLVAGVLAPLAEMQAQSPLIISEFRVRGPNGANDEFVEIYNNSDSPDTVNVTDGSTGFSVAASDGVVRFVIPNGTVIPARGHYLGVNSIAYSLGSYPAGYLTTATGDATYTTDIPDNAGIALFNTSNPANFNLSNRLDAVGSTSEANTLYKEGSGYPALTPFSIDYCFHRKVFTGLPVDTDDNASDFIFEDTNGTSAGAGQRLGAPGPENLSGPVTAGSLILVTVAEPSVDANSAPNLIREYTSDPPNNSTFGTLALRYKIKNVGGVPVTRVRLRIDSLTTFPSGSGIADLRPRTSSSASIGVFGGTDTAQATTLEQPPSQPNGGGYNSSMSVNTVTLGTPLAAGDSIFVNILLGIQQTGDFTITFTPEGLPGGGITLQSDPIATRGNTEATPVFPSLLISEFRLRGPNGANDEFVEIYNNSDDSVLVNSADGSSGFSVAASDGAVRFVIPNGTVIPARGHYLGVNSNAYSLSSYPAGNGTTATGDATYTTDIADNAGIALFASSNSANFSTSTRLDAVGSTSEANTLYKEGSGYPALTPFSIDYCFHRKAFTGLPVDTDDNASDFIFEDTNGTSAGAGQRLGAPGPENLSSPVTAGSLILVSVADPSVDATSAPNLVRDHTSDPGNNSTFGTLALRYKIKNVGGVPVTRVRLRVDSLTTFPSASGIADLRPRTSSSASILISGGTVTAEATTLEQPPSQPNGGGYNSSLGANTVTIGTPIAPGDSIYVNILLGIQQTGDFTITYTPEGLPGGGITLYPDVIATRGNTETAPVLPPLLISEFRVRGPSGANDEFVEIYNNSDDSITVNSTDGSAGFGVAASDGVLRFTIPNGTVIPARGHYLGVNSAAYSLASYPAGNGTTATGDATYTTDIPDNAGIALFSGSYPANFSTSTRMDAVGSTSEANALYKEGSGYPALTPFSIDYCFHRKVDTGLPQDTDDNAADFKFEDTNGTSAGAGQRLGAPGPENLSSPVTAGSLILVTVADPSVDANSTPNLVRDYTSDPPNNSTFGSLALRYKVKNVGGVPVTRVRLRVDSLTTFPSTAGIADLRPRTSSSASIGISGGTFTAVATTLEQPPSQPNGGGHNSSMGVGSVDLGTPIAPGDSIFINILLGIQQTGYFAITYTPEGLPGGGITLYPDVIATRGNTETAPALPPLLISEFRVRGPSGGNDEFVEIYNNSDDSITVNSTDGSAGFAVAASDGAVRFTIPNGTVIPARGHYLGVNSNAYSLASYPAGNGTTATGDATYTTDIPDNAGIALFSGSYPANFSTSTRLDAVGSTSEANSLYKEGVGYPAITPFSIDYCFHRKVDTGLPQDTDDNSADFKFEDTNGTSAGAGQWLGAPGPENLSSPVTAGSLIQVSLADPTVDAISAPNRVRDYTSDPPNNSTFGTLALFYKIKNVGGVPVTRVRLRVDSITTFPSPSGIADLRPRTSSPVSITIPGGTFTAEATTLEQPPSQPNGGGYNSSMGANTVTTGTPIAPGDSIYVNILLGLQQTGNYTITFTPEGLPGGGITLYPDPIASRGNTETSPPAAPQDLVVTDSASTAVGLVWRKNTEADFLRYHIYGGTSPNPTSLMASATGGVNDRSKIIGGLTNGTRYYFRVTAVDSALGESGYSNEVDAVPADRFPPAAPQDLAVTDSASTMISLVWRKNTEADLLRYRIYGGTSPNPTAQVDSTSDSVDDTSKAIANLTNGTRYYFRVTAVDSAEGESGYSNEVDGVPADRIAPAAPQTLVVTDSSSTVISLVWTKNTEADVLRYRIYGGTSPNPTAQVDSTSDSADDTSKTIANLTNGTRYYFRVTSIDSVENESGYSNEVDAVPADRIAPVAPQNLAVTDSSSTVISIVWMKNTESDVLRYRIYGGTSPNPTSQIDSTSDSADDTSKTIANLINGTRYYFRVTAIDSVENESGYSNEVNAVPGDRIPPAAPQNLAVTDSSSMVISLVWAKNTEADILRYRIYGGTSPNPTAQVDSTGDSADDTSKTIANLTNGTRYYFRVTAVDSAGGESGYSNEADAVPADRVAPAAPQNLAVTDSSSTQIGIAWRQNSEADFLKYMIYRGTGPNPTTLVDSSSASLSDTSKTFTGLVNGTRYYFRVTALDSARNESAYSNEVNAAPDVANEISDILNQIPEVYTLSQNYPNPFNPSTVIRYGLPERSSVLLELYDMLGRRIAVLVDGEQEASHHEVVWNADVPSGVYFYRIYAVAASNPERVFQQIRRMVFIK